MKRYAIFLMSILLLAVTAACAVPPENTPSGGNSESSSAVMPDSHPSETEQAAVSVDFAPEDGNYDEVVLESSEYSSRLLFTANDDVTMFTLLELTFENFRDDGTVEFSARPVAADSVPDCLSPDHPVVVELVFPGDLPSYGFSYLDRNGNTHWFAIEISGKDGSVFLGEADFDGSLFVLK